MKQRGKDGGLLSTSSWSSLTNNEPITTISSITPWKLDFKIKLIKDKLKYNYLHKQKQSLAERDLNCASTASLHRLYKVLKLIQLAMSFSANVKLFVNFHITDHFSTFRTSNAENI